MKHAMLPLLEYVLANAVQTVLPQDVVMESRIPEKNVTMLVLMQLDTTVKLIALVPAEMVDLKKERSVILEEKITTKMPMPDAEVLVSLVAVEMVLLTNNSVRNATLSILTMLVRQFQTSIAPLIVNFVVVTTLLRLEKSVTQVFIMAKEITIALLNVNGPDVVTEWSNLTRNATMECLTVTQRQMLAEPIVNSQDVVTELLILESRVTPLLTVPLFAFHFVVMDLWMQEKNVIMDGQTTTFHQTVADLTVSFPSVATESRIHWKSAILQPTVIHLTTVVKIVHCHTAVMELPILSMASFVTTEHLTLRQILLDAVLSVCQITAIPAQLVVKSI